MGPESGDLVAEVERRFGVVLPAAQVAGIGTAGDLYASVMQLLLVGRRPGAGCPTAKAFYRLRRAMMQVLPVRREQVRPSTSLEELLPDSGRREVWKRLEERVGAKLPPLESHGGNGPGALVFLAVVSWGMALLIGRGDFAWALGSTGIVLAVLAWAIPWAKYLPAGLTTVGDLARRLVETNPAAFYGAELPDAATVWRGVQRVVAEGRAVDIEQVTPSTQVS